MSTRLLVFLLCLLVIAILFRPLSRKPCFPVSLVLIITGLVIGQIVTALDLDAGLRWYHFQDLLIEILLPLLLFRAALALDVEQLQRHSGTIVLLSLPLMLFMLATTACVLFFGINHPTGFPWLAAWLTAALLTATDMDMASAWMNHAGRRDVAIILEGESVTNDTTALVLFSLLLGMATSSAHTEADLLPVTLIAFGSALLFGILSGIGMGMLQRWLLGYIHNPRLQVLVSIIVLYLTYLLARDVLGGSAVIAVVVLGLVSLKPRSPRGRLNLRILKRFWTLPATLAEYIIYLLAGVTITLTMFSDQWFAMLLGIGAVLCIRMLVVAWLLPAGQKLAGIQRLDRQGRLLLGWGGGIRSVFTLALALSLPLTVDYWYTIQSIAYGVALFSLFVQSGSLAAWLAFRGNGLHAD